MAYRAKSVVYTTAPKSITSGTPEWVNYGAIYTVPANTTSKLVKVISSGTTTSGGASYPNLKLDNTSNDGTSIFLNLGSYTINTTYIDDALYLNAGQSLCFVVNYAGNTTSTWTNTIYLSVIEEYEV